MEDLEDDAASMRSDRGTFFERRWNSWIKLNVSWSSKWWYSMVQTLTAVIGAGVLSLPSAMAFLRWELGTMALCLFIVFSLVCYWQIIELHEMDEQRFDRYHELGQHVLGKRLGFWVVVPLQLLVEIGVDTVYVITAASSLAKVHELLGGGHVKLHFWMLAFMGVQLFLSQLPHLASITWVSVIAAATAVGYSTIAWISFLLPQNWERRSDPRHDYPHYAAATVVFGVFSSLGKFAFASAAAHNIAMEIQATIPSTRQRASKIPMWNGTLFSYLIITLCYLPVALIGYAYYGWDKQPDTCLKIKLHDCHILLLLDKPRWLIVLANLMVVTHMSGSYQIYAMPLFDVLESFVEQTFQVKSKRLLKFCLRSSYNGMTLLLAASLPFFSDLQSFIGGFATIPTTYLIPSILWYLSFRPRPLSLPWLGSMTLICVSILLMVTSSVGGMRSLIVNWGKYKTFL